MAYKKTEEAVYGYREFKADIKKGAQKSVYVFHGEENYLLRDALSMLRSQVAEGTEEFNHRRFEGKEMSLSDFADAVNTFPMFSDKVLVEIWDYDFSAADEETKTKMIQLLSEADEYVCVVFVYDTAEFKLDGRLKINGALKKLLTVVEFKIQDMGSLLGWIRSHFAAEGKDISPALAEHFAVMTGGQMTLMLSEIEKLSAYCSGTEITRKDIDETVTPVINTAIYEMMGRMIERDYDGAGRRLSDLIAMDEPPQRIIYDVTAALRLLLGARLSIDNGVDIEKYIDIFDMKKRAFLAKRYFSTARAVSADNWAKALSEAANTAYLLNSAPIEGRELLSELLVKLAICIEAK